MATIKRFEDLEVWQAARKQCIDIEKLLVEVLCQRNQRLKDQLQGSSGSVMDNIAEGFEKENRKEFINFLFHAKASAGEMRSQLIRVSDFGYFNKSIVEPLIVKSETLSRQIWAFIVYLKGTNMEGMRHVSEPDQFYAGNNIEPGHEL
ncbi:MAG TPA: four helix bundle protein [Flavobacteriales bacterium]|nr:four helix bundle protein [Flavobacteriales bacterium]